MNGPSAKDRQTVKKFPLGEEREGGIHEYS